MKNKKLLVILLIIVVLVIIILLFINNRNSYKYIYDNVLIEEDSNIGLYIVDKNKKIDTKNKNYKKVVDNKINDILKQEIDIENMILIYNPYDTNKNSIKIYFITNYDVITNYKLTVNGNTSDFTSLGSNYTTQHEYEIDNIVLGEVNKLEFEVRDRENKLIDTKIVELDFRNVK